MAMFTALAEALSKYYPERVMEHLRIFWGRWVLQDLQAPVKGRLTIASRINIPKAIRAMEEAHLWPELVFLYTHYDEYDNAALAMMERAADAWEHQTFKETIVKVANLEIFYK